MYVQHTCPQIILGLMFTKRTTFNPKRRINDNPVKVDLELIVGHVNYGGNPEHKRNPGDFGLTPPASPRPDKTLCDGAYVSKRAVALSLLKDGIQRGLVSKKVRNGYPQNVWAVSDKGIPVEAQLENSNNGTYHGYPMPVDDPFREIVLSKWNSKNE